ncbi:MAG: VanZ family protein, partial [Gemmatimonadaceae bacterium]|nr:VanZ family protein [Gemmatimonadaceae bacterium]
MLDPRTARRVGLAARAAYVGIILLATLTGFHADLSASGVLWRAHRAVHWAARGIDVVDAARNVALFAGFGVVWIVTLGREHPWRQIVRVTFLGTALSMCVELAQLFSASRTSSINDVATNAAGAFLGAFLIVVMTALARRAHGLRTFVGLPIFTIAGSYLAAAGAEMFSPLDRHEYNPGAGGSIMNRLANALHYVRPLTPHSIPRFDMALLCPAGILAVGALVELGASYAVACVLTAIGGLVLAAAVEVAHGIAGQPIELGAIASHAIGIAAGVLLGWGAIPALAHRLQGRGRATLLLVAYALVLVAWAWRPFVIHVDPAAIARQLSAPHLTPLGVLGATEDLFGVMDVAEQFFLYLPLGCLLAVWPLRVGGRLGLVWPGLYFAAALEIGQLGVVGRTFDVTDLLTQCAAIGVG